MTIDSPSSGADPVALTRLAEAPGTASLVQPLSAGLLAAIVGFASAFPVVLQGLSAVGATPAQAASGLLALCIGQGLLAIGLSLATRQPIAIAWSTPGAALLVATGAPEGGFPVAIGAFLVTAVLILVAGLWRPLGRAAAAIPMPLAGAMLAGVLLDLSLAPVRAVNTIPVLALPVVLVWALAWRFARLYAVPIALVVTMLIVFVATPFDAAALGDPWPNPVLVTPVFTLSAAIGIGLPLFIVAMASQNVPGLAVLRSNGYQPEVGPIFRATGLASAATSVFGGHGLNLSAITAALCAGPEAHPDPGRRYLAAVAGGAAYVGIGLFAGLAASFIAASPPLLIQAVAGLALLSSLAGALMSALADEDARLPAAVTFVTTASGLSVFGIGAAFWGLVAGGALLMLQRTGRVA